MLRKEQAKEADTPMLAETNTSIQTRSPFLGKQCSLFFSFQLQTLDTEAVMVGTVLSPWAIPLVIFAAVLVMSLLMLLPPAAVVLWRMKRVPQVSLQGSV